MVVSKKRRAKGSMVTHTNHFSLINQVLKITFLSLDCVANDDEFIVIKMSITNVNDSLFQTRISSFVVQMINTRYF